MLAWECVGWRSLCGAGVAGRVPFRGVERGVFGVVPFSGLPLVDLMVPTRALIGEHVDEVSDL